VRVRATLRLRNDHIIAARERLGLSQFKAAELAGVPHADLCKLEAMRYDISFMEDKAAKVAKAFEVPIEQVAPPGLVDAALTTTFVAIRDVKEAALVNRASTVTMLEGPEEAADNQEFYKRIHGAMNGLTPVQRTIIEMRHGLDGKGGEKSWTAIGKKVGKSGIRAKQIHTALMARMAKKIDAKTALSIKVNE